MNDVKLKAALDSLRDMRAKVCTLEKVAMEETERANLLQKNLEEARVSFRDELRKKDDEISALNLQCAAFRSVCIFVIITSSRRQQQ